MLALVLLLSLQGVSLADAPELIAEEQANTIGARMPLMINASKGFSVQRRALHHVQEKLGLNVRCRPLAPCHQPSHPLARHCERAALANRAHPATRAATIGRPAPGPKLSGVRRAVSRRKMSA